MFYLFFLYKYCCSYICENYLSTCNQFQAKTTPKSSTAVESLKIMHCWTKANFFFCLLSFSAKKPQLGLNTINDGNGQVTRIKTKIHVDNFLWQKTYWRALKIWIGGFCRPLRLDTKLAEKKKVITAMIDRDINNQITQFCPFGD